MSIASFYECYAGVSRRICVVIRGPASCEECPSFGYMFSRCTVIAIIIIIIMIIIMMIIITNNKYIYIYTYNIYI